MLLDLLTPSLPTKHNSLVWNTAMEVIFKIILVKRKDLLKTRPLPSSNKF